MQFLRFWSKIHSTNYPTRTSLTSFSDFRHNISWMFSEQNLRDSDESYIKDISTLRKSDEVWQIRWLLKIGTKSRATAVLKSGDRTTVARRMRDFSEIFPATPPFLQAREAPFENESHEIALLRRTRWAHARQPFAYGETVAAPLDRADFTGPDWAVHEAPFKDDGHGIAV